MSSRARFLLGAAAGVFGLGMLPKLAASAAPPAPSVAPGAWKTLTKAQWHARLTPAQYAVMREAGTEAPFSSPLLDEHAPGRFDCAGCRLALFDSRTKFDSHTGWPSFFRALPNAVAEHTDDSIPGESRTEVHCRRCESHLGHVFNDGPAPTGLRYCMNGVALGFDPAK